MGTMAVQFVYVLTSVWMVAAPSYRSFPTHDECRDAAISEIEQGAMFAYCTEGYAAPPKYLPWHR